jgi:hypothetical protein
METVPLVKGVGQYTYCGRVITIDIRARVKTWNIRASVNGRRPQSIHSYTSAIVQKHTGLILRVNQDGVPSRTACGRGGRVHGPLRDETRGCSSENQAKESPASNQG